MYTRFPNKTSLKEEGKTLTSGLVDKTKPSFFGGGRREMKKKFSGFRCRSQIHLPVVWSSRRTLPSACLLFLVFLMFLPYASTCICTTISCSYIVQGHFTK